MKRTSSPPSRDCENENVDLEAAVADKETKRQHRRHCHALGPPALPSGDHEFLKRIYRNGRETPVQLSSVLWSLNRHGISLHELCTVFCSLSHDGNQSVRLSELEALARGELRVRVNRHAAKDDPHFPLPELRVALAARFPTTTSPQGVTMEFLAFAQTLERSIRPTVANTRPPGKTALAKSPGSVLYRSL